jgi:hypothetical protein
MMHTGVPVLRAATAGDVDLETRVSQTAPLRALTRFPIRPASAAPPPYPAHDGPDVVGAEVGVVLPRPVAEGGALIRVGKISRVWPPVFPRARADSAVMW